MMAKTVASAQFTIRFDDYSTRSYTLSPLSISGSGLTNFKVRLKSLKYNSMSTLEGLLVGKDGESKPIDIESGKITVETNTIVWTKTGGLINND